MDRTVHVNHKEGDLFEIVVRDHVLHVDQPVEDGGTDVAPTPTELCVVALASCVAFYARRFLARHGVSESGLSVTASYAMAERPARIGEIRLTLHVSEEVPEERRAALLAVASHCTVHNTFDQPPVVSIELALAA